MRTSIAPDIEADAAATWSIARGSSASAVACTHEDSNDDCMDLNFDEQLHRGKNRIEKASWYMQWLMRCVF